MGPDWGKLRHSRRVWPKARGGAVRPRDAARSGVGQEDVGRDVQRIVLAMPRLGSKPSVSMKVLTNGKRSLFGAGGRHDPGAVSDVEGESEHTTGEGTWG